MLEADTKEDREEDWLDRDFQAKEGGSSSSSDDEDPPPKKKGSGSNKASHKQKKENKSSVPKKKAWFHSSLEFISFSYNSIVMWPLGEEGTDPR